MPPCHCYDCNRMFGSHEALEQHTRDKHPTSFECNYCDREFRSTEARDMHEAAVHPRDCDECDRSFNSPSALEQHKRDKHPTSFECDYCDREFRSAESRDMHEAAVHPRDCDECDRSFRSPSALEQHKQAKHTFECGYCDREFKSAESRDMHEVTVHYRDCDECGRSFNSPSALEQHTRDKHPTSFECNYCDRVFRSAESCDMHEAAVHARDCDECDRSFRSPSALGQHKRDKHSNSFECDHCNCVFSSSQACKQHESSVHDCWDRALSQQEYTSRRMYGCERCGFVLFSASALEEHRHTRHPFMCHTCFHDFVSAETRDQHLRAEHPVCAECGKRFSVEELKEHQQVEHPSYKCSSCGSEFTSISARDHHQETVHANLSTESEGCSRSAVVDNTDMDHPFTEPLDSAVAPNLATNSLVGHTSSSTPTESVDMPSRSLETLRRSPHPDIVSDIVLPNDATRKYTDNDASTETLSEKDDTGNEQTARICLTCHSIFDTDEDCHNHGCKSHESEIPVHCSYCYSLFEDEGALEKHLDEREQFCCKICGLQLCSKAMLQDHLDSHPTCQKCGTLFGDESELYRHTEHAHPIIVCWDCDGAVISQQSLPLHYASEHPSCPVCDIRMKGPNMLDGHINNEHNESTAIERRASEECNVQHSGDKQTDSFAETNESVLLRREGMSDSSETYLSFTAPSSQFTLDEDANGTAASRAHGGEENRNELRQKPPPSPTPSVNGSDITKSETIASVAQGLRLPQLDSPGSSLVITESFGGTSDGSSPSSSSQSIVYVTADSMPEYIRENRAYLVATSAPSQPSSGSTSPVRLPSALSSLDSLELVPGALDSSPPSTVGKNTARSQLRLHCRICNRDPCEDMTATICGHIFCKNCITQAVVSNSECPVCKNATLLYCLFRLDLSV